MNLNLGNLSNLMTTDNIVGTAAGTAIYLNSFIKKINVWNQAINLYASTSPGVSKKEFDLPLAARLMAISVHGNFLETILPALILPVNPRKFRVEHRKKSSYRYTLGGFVLNHWHPDLSTITADGYIPSFKGKSKALSESFWVFMALLKIYRSCGEIDNIVKPPASVSVPAGFGTEQQQLDIPSPNQQATSNKVPKTETKLIVSENTLRNAELKLWYNSDVYTGIFTSFTIEEDEEYPNTLLYSFNFSARDHQNIIGDAIPELMRLTTSSVLGYSAIKGTFTSGLTGRL